MSTTLIERNIGLHPLQLELHQLLNTRLYDFHISKLFCMKTIHRTAKMESYIPQR